MLTVTEMRDGKQKYTLHAQHAVLLYAAKLQLALDITASAMQSTGCLSPKYNSNTSQKYMTYNQKISRQSSDTHNTHTTYTQSFLSDTESTTDAMGVPGGGVRMKLHAWDAAVA